MSAIEPIDVRRYGAGPGPVVLLHGGPGAQGYMAPLARELASDFQVLEPLQRLAGSGPLTVARHVADLVSVVPERSILVGSSWGAMLALSSTAAHPAIARGIVLIGCGTYDLDSRADYQRMMNDRLGPAAISRVRDLRRKLVAATGADEKARIFEVLATTLTRAQSVDLTTTDLEVKQYDPRGNVETWADAVRLQARGIEPEAFAAIKAPILMLHGDSDPHPGPSTRDTLLRFVPHVEYIELDRCGHMPWLERHARERFLKLLRGWLSARMQS